VTLSPEREAELLALVPGDAATRLDADGLVLEVTSGVEDILGYTPAQYQSHEPIDLIHPSDHAMVRRNWRDLLVEPGRRSIIEARARHRNGSYRWFEVVQINLLHDPKVQGVVSGFTDISERRGGNLAGQPEFENLVEASPDVIGTVGTDGTITWISTAIHEMLGREADDMVGRPAWEFIHPDDVAAAVDRLASAIDRIDSVNPIAVRASHTDGSWVPVEIAGGSIRDANGGVGGLVINIRDIRWRNDAVDALRSSEQLFRTLAQSSPIGIYHATVDDGLVYVNDRWCDITGVSAEDARGNGWAKMIHPDDTSIVGLDQGPTPMGGRAVTIEFRVVRPDGDLRWVRVQSGPLRHADGSLVGTVGTLDDITSRRDTERERQRLIDIFEATEDLVGICDDRGGLLYLNAAAKRTFGFESDVEVARHVVEDLFPPSIAERLDVEIRPEVERTGRWEGELTMLVPDVGLVPVSAQVLLHQGTEDEGPHFSAILHDISERKAFEHRLAHQATHDPLTGLPNRSLLIDRLEGALARARRHNRRVAVLFLDLDHFKVVNDSLGHGLGDRLLVAIAERLAVALRPGDTVARFGGDEFVVLCEDLVTQHDAIAIAERVDQAVSGPFVIDDTEVFVGVSIGIALPDDTEADPETLIRDADAAMYRAKDRGRSRWELFDNAMRASAVDRLDIENALRRALDRRELRVYYQPVVDLASGPVDGVEALLRWEHPERGLLNPGDFITVAEETGLIVPIGAWVLDQACRQVQRWHASAERTAPLSVAINISGRQLGHPRLVDDLASVLADTSIDPSLVELEITESVLMDDVEMSAETLGRLHALGVHLAVDDFGTGYSSLSYLRRFPVDILKVDQSFVDGLGEDSSDSAIVTAIITLAHTLGLRAVAEGVESELQLAELRRLGCDRAQGFLMARPASGHDVGELLAGNRRW
jgi:diguanylate cyclase (GGDEF)-like protein/PAS domain S-box-containing protein